MRTFYESYYLSEDKVQSEPEGGPFLRTTMDDIPLSARPEAPPRTGPRRGRNRRVYDRKRHNWKAQVLNKIVMDEDGSVGDLPVSHTGAGVQIFDPLLGLAAARRRIRKKLRLSGERRSDYE
jgi:hypothetical protein